MRVERLEPRHLLSIAPAASSVAPSGDSRIDAVLAGYKWGVTNITYSFYDGGGYYGTEANPTPVSTAVRDNVRTILNTVISPLVNLTFTEVVDLPTSYGLIRYLCSTTPQYAFAYYPWGSDTNGGTIGDRAGDVVLNTSSDVAGNSNNSFRQGPGSHGFQTLIHETCHALGLKHPGDYNVGGSATPPFLPFGQDNWDNSLMTYNFACGAEPVTPMAYDILALGYLYGAKTATRAGNTTYTFTAADMYTASDGSSAGLASRRSKNMLWDGGGTDTIDLAGLPTAVSGYRIDIGSGGWITPMTSYNSVKYDASSGSPTTFSAGTTYSATDYGTRLPLAGTTIENVIVSGANDLIFVNSAANLISGYIAGIASGNDVITGADQSDTLELTQFLESSVAMSQSGNDLLLNLGMTGTVTIKDYFAVPAVSRPSIAFMNPPTVSVAAAAADKAEGNADGSTAFTFTVTRSGTLSIGSTVAWAVTGSGTAAATAADFTGGALPSGILLFAVGETTKTITVNVAADATIEADEGFTVTLSAPSGATLGSPASVPGTIRNDDFPPPPTVSIAAAAAAKAEGTGAGPTAFTFTVTRSGDLASGSSLAWAVTGSGTNAANATDFVGDVLPSGTLSFAAGEASKTITVNVAADATIEADEGFTIALSAPTGATLGSPTSASGTIRNDDQPVLSIGDVTVTEGDSGAVTVMLAVTLSAATFGPVTVAYATFDGTATLAGNDFAAAMGTLTFAVGETSKMITVLIRGDSRVEPDETFGVRLSASSGATIAKAVGNVTILNNDYRSWLSIAATDAVKSEGDSGRTSFSFTLTRTGSLDGEVTVPWAVAGSGTDRADRLDFIGSTLPSGAIRLAAGRRNQTITVNVLCDRMAEFDEQFTITLGNPLGGLDALAAGGASASGTIVNDDAGTPRPTASNPAQVQAFAGFGTSGAAATIQAIATQGFAALDDPSGPLATTTTKRPAWVESSRN